MHVQLEVLFGEADPRVHRYIHIMEQLQKPIVLYIHHIQPEQTIISHVMYIGKT
jgi:hypothetical protein